MLQGYSPTFSKSIADNRVKTLGFFPDFLYYSLRRVACNLWAQAGFFGVARPPKLYSCYR